MATYWPLDTAGRIDFATTALTNLAADAGMDARMVRRKHGAAAGLPLLEAAVEAHRAQSNERSDQLQATDSARATWGVARKQYMKDLRLARVAMKDDRAARHDLGLDGRRARGLARAIDQVHDFYHSATTRPELLAKLEEVGFESEDLVRGLERVTRVRQARAEQRWETEGSESATTAKKAALDALDAWMGRFLEVARVEFEDEPQKLEKLGIRVRG